MFIEQKLKSDNILQSQSMALPVDQSNCCKQIFELPNEMSAYWRGVTAHAQANIAKQYNASDTLQYPITWPVLK